MACGLVSETIFKYKQCLYFCTGSAPSPCCFEKTFFCLWRRGTRSMTGLKKVTWSTKTQHNKPHILFPGTTLRLYWSLPFEYNVCVWKDICIRPFCGWTTPLLCVHTHVPLLAAVPEAPVPAELYVSGYPGSLPASHTSEHTKNDSPSSKRRSQAPLTNT